MSRLRPVLAEDAADLAEIHAACFPAPWSAAEIADQLAGFGAFGLAVELEAAGGRPTGFILCRGIAGDAEVLTLAVSPLHRRGGLGRVLLEAAAGLTLAAGAEALFLEVAADNEPALGLYLGAGFEAAGRRKGYYAKGRPTPVDALVLRRTLNRDNA